MPRLAARRRRGEGLGGLGGRGRRTVKRVPLPGSLSTRMWPPLWWTMPWTVARPRPVPLPRSLVVKNGSKRCSSTSGGMPVPVSPTVSRT